MCLRKFGPINIVVEPAQRLGHALAMDALPPPLAFFVLLFAGWVNRQHQAMIDYLLEENRVLRTAQPSYLHGHSALVRASSRRYAGARRWAARDR